MKAFCLGLAVLIWAVPLWASGENTEDTDVFKVKIVADQGFREARGNDIVFQGDAGGNSFRRVPKWRYDLTDLVARVNFSLQSQNIKVRLEIVEISEWRRDSSASDTLCDALHDMQRKFPKGGCDLVIGLTRGAFPKDDALGYHSSGCIVVKDRAYPAAGRERAIRVPELALEVLLHEIGHFFGLGHCASRDSLMFATVLPGQKHCYFLKEEAREINERARRLKPARSGQ